MQPAKTDPSKKCTKPKTMELPFYAPPLTSKTSAEIINEARASIRAVNTKRPFTPREEDRRLFGSKVKLTYRPPSSFSLNESHYESGDSRPVSAVRLQPLEQNPKIKLNFDCETSSNTNALENNNSARLPSIPNDRGFSLDTYYSIQLPDNITVDSLRRRRSQPVVTKLPADCVNSEEKTEVDREGNCLQIRRHSLKPTSTFNLKSTIKLDDKDSQDTQVSANQEADIYYKTKIIPLLDEYFPSRDIDENHFCDVTRQLYLTLEASNLLGKNFAHRSSVLKVLYKLLDTKHQQLQLQLARVILAMKVKGNNLSTLCKLIFKVTRSDINDQLFLEDNLLEVFLEAVSTMHPIQDSEALVYGVGALKFLSMNSTLLRELSNLGCIDVITKLISTINTQKEDLNKLPEQISHVLFQLTGCLRNLAEGAANRHSFISSGVIPILISCLRLFQEEVDVVMNIARILSKLTTHSDICNVVTSVPSSFEILMTVLQKYDKRKDLVVRIAFILGNLTAKNDDARLLLFTQSKSVDCLLELLHLYLQFSFKNNHKNSSVDDVQSSDMSCTESESEDIVVKIIRVIANMSIHPDVGPVVATNDMCLDHILTILNKKNKPDSQELILSTLATLNNLSYYSVEKGVIANRLLEITEHLVSILLKENGTELLEVTRVLGNLTRSCKVRDFLNQMKVLHMMITTLDSRNKELVYTSCGVLINFMADEDKRKILRSEGGVRKLIDVLKDFGCNDWQLASMVCQALWNYTSKMTDVTYTLGDVEATELITLLEELLNENTAMEGCFGDKVDGLLQESIHDEWALVFSPVAENLLRRIEKVIG